ncbi:VOC family protein [Telmatospirillum sp. J64-1]|uniref:VOC family protein n=1 Tax=Telmatospirillum sp. J64-1 TaxID=2502183 RepID=UPI00115D7B07|nr:VOC family protein [Telmatospirillum sp. J64-1]
MYNHVRGLDHVVIAVRDEQQGREKLKRLGFALAPHGVQFLRDRLELAEGGGQGLAALGFATDDIQAAGSSLSKAGVILGEPREVTLGEGGARFRLIDLDASATPGASSRICQYLTPERLMEPDWLRHPNGALGIRSVTVAVDDPEGVALAWGRVFGPGSTTPTDDLVAVHTDAAMIFLSRPDDVDQMHPDADLDEPPAAPMIFALTISVADTDKAADVLKEGQVPFTRDKEGSVRIEAEDGCGFYLELVRG